MKPINKNALIRSVVITLITSWFTWLCIWPSSCNKSLPLGDGHQSSMLFKNQHIQLVSQYRSQMAGFKIVNDSLQKELSLTRQKLRVYQSEASRNKILVQNLIRKQSTDTIEKLADCDSLKQEVTSYITIVEQKDSLQQKAITELQAIVTSKDSTLASCEQNFSFMSKLADNAIVQEQKAEQDLENADKKAKHKTSLIHFLEGTTIVLAGITTLFIIK